MHLTQLIYSRMTMFKSFTHVENKKKHASAMFYECGIDDWDHRHRTLQSVNEILQLPALITFINWSLDILGMDNLHCKLRHSKIFCTLQLIALQTH